MNQKSDLRSYIYVFHINKNSDFTSQLYRFSSNDRFSRFLDFLDFLVKIF